MKCLNEVDLEKKFVLNIDINIDRNLRVLLTLRPLVSFFLNEIPSSFPNIRSFYFLKIRDRSGGYVLGGHSGDTPVT